MRKLSTKEILLALLIVGLGFVVYVQYQRGAFSSGEPAEDIRAAGKTASVEGLPPILEVDLEKLTPGQGIRKHSRNLFNYSRSPDEIAEEVRQRNEAEKQAKFAEERRQAQLIEQQRLAALQAQALRDNPPPIPPPAINFRFIGKMGEPRAPIAILADGASGEVMTVREGEVIGEKFKVRKIEYDSVTIGYVDPKWSETKTIKMGT